MLDMIDLADLGIAVAPQPARTPITPRRLPPRPAAPEALVEQARIDVLDDEDAMVAAMVRVKAAKRTLPRRRMLLTLTPSRVSIDRPYLEVTNKGFGSGATIESRMPAPGRIEMVVPWMLREQARAVADALEPHAFTMGMSATMSQQELTATLRRVTERAVEAYGAITRETVAMATDPSLLASIEARGRWEYGLPLATAEFVDLLHEWLPWQPGMPERMHVLAAPRTA